MFMNINDRESLDIALHTGATCILTDRVNCAVQTIKEMNDKSSSKEKKEFAKVH